MASCSASLTNSCPLTRHRRVPPTHGEPQQLLNLAVLVDSFECRAACMFPGVSCRHALASCFAQRRFRYGAGSPSGAEVCHQGLQAHGPKRRLRARDRDDEALQRLEAPRLEPPLPARAPGLCVCVASCIAAISLRRAGGEGGVTKRRRMSG